MRPRTLPLCLLAIAGLALATRPEAAPNPRFHVFLAFGQSNMEGQAPPEAQDSVPDPRFLDLSAVTCGNRTEGAWLVSIAPTVRCDTYLGPLDWFGRTLADSLPATDTVGVVPVAVAGTAIRGFFPTAAATYYAAQATWMQSIAAEYGGSPYTRLLAMAKIAQQRGVIAGILLHQGETDAYDAGWRDSVKIVYDSLLADLGLTATDVPLLAGEVAPTGASSGANATIDLLPQTIPTAHVISSAGLTIGTYANNQNVHFSADSYRTLGARYAQAMDSLMKTGAATSIARPGIPGLSIVTTSQGVTIRSAAPLDRASLVSVRGETAELGSGTEVRIRPGRFRPGVYFLRAVSAGNTQTREVVVER
jgi:hypothetical protein